ncbi:hypothetical protein [Polaribacter tangerinus]|uniref:hypothetical protein n=1 Tax=Polaribacter tangerinus TaxID=1920034 RepID=UPI000B4B04B8|nr:hypothetical protein [Polaribacter tangerinus]
MKYLQTNKFRHFFWLLIKLTIVFGCCYIISQKLIVNNQLRFSVIELKVFSLNNLLPLLSLSIINWLLEIKKWQILVSNYKMISYKNASIQSLASLTTSIITPNRIGEYGAKMLFFDKNIRKKIITFNFTSVINWFFVVIMCSICIVLILKYKESVKNIFRKYAVQISKKKHVKIGVLSFLRYLVFSHQWYLLVIIFNIDVSYITAISTIFTMYLISSFIPMLTLLDVVVKGAVAVLLFSKITTDTVSILSIATIMWFLNFAIPAILGSYFVLTFKPKFVK